MLYLVASLSVIFELKIEENELRAYLNKSKTFIKSTLFSLDIYKFTACRFFDFVERKNITLEKVYC